MNFDMSDSLCFDLGGWILLVRLVYRNKQKLQNQKILLDCMVLRIYKMNLVILGLLNYLFPFGIHNLIYSLNILYNHYYFELKKHIQNY